jgi:hypothetical protein
MGSILKSSNEDRMAVLPEDIEQINFVNWFRHNHPDIMIFHVPNGGKRNAREAARLKQMGVLAGIPDLFIPSLMLWIEMKRTKGGSLSKHQKEIIPKLESYGYKVFVCKGFEDAKKQFEAFY